MNRNKTFFKSIKNHTNNEHINISFGKPIFQKKKI